MITNKIVFGFMFLLLVTTVYGYDVCIADVDCVEGEWCNVDLLICELAHPLYEACNRDGQCLTGNCIVDQCRQVHEECYADYIGCQGSAWKCDMGTCVYEERRIKRTKFAGGLTSSLKEVTGEKTDIILHKSNVQITFKGVDLNNAIDFDAKCDIGPGWVSCNEMYDAPATITIVNRDWAPVKINGLMVMRNGLKCSGVGGMCANFRKLDSDTVAFEVDGFSNYTVVNSSSYDAVMSNITAPTWVYMGTEDEPRHISVMFQLTNSLGDSLQDVTCEIYILDNITGILIQDLKTKLHADEEIANVTRAIPFTDSRGWYRYVFPIIDYPYFSGRNYTMHVTCLYQEKMHTFEVRGFQPSNLDDEVEYYQSAMQDIVLGGILFIAIVYAILAVIKKYRTGGLFT